MASNTLWSDERWITDDEIQYYFTTTKSNPNFIYYAVVQNNDLANETINTALTDDGPMFRIIPVNTGAHWTALVIKKESNATTALYNDSCGGNMPVWLRNKLFNAKIVDYKLQQQNDAISCGAYTVKNIARFILGWNLIKYTPTYIENFRKQLKQRNSRFENII